MKTTDESTDATRNDESGELAALAGLWQAAPDSRPPQVPTARLARRWRAQLLGLAALEVVILLALVAWTATAWSRRPGTIELVLWVNAWILAVVVLTYALWNRRGMWRPLTESTTCFLAHWQERCRRGLRTVVFVRAVVAIEVALLLTVLIATGRGGSTAYLALGVIAAGYQLWSMLFKASCQRQLAHIASLKREYRADAESARAPAEKGRL